MKKKHFEGKRDRLFLSILIDNDEYVYAKENQIEKMFFAHIYTQKISM